MKCKTINTVCLLLVLLLPSICFSLNLKEAVEIKNIPTYIIENTSYCKLNDFLEIINCGDSWGRVENRIFILYGNDEIKFRINDKHIIYAGKNKDLNHPIKEIEGEIFIPVDDFGKVIDKILITPKQEQKTTKNKIFPIKETSISRYSLPTEFEFKVHKRLWKLLWNPSLPLGKTAEEKVVQQVAKEFSISTKAVDTINVKFAWYNQYSNKSCENMTWQEFKILRDRVGAPK